LLEAVRVIQRGHVIWPYIERPADMPHGIVQAAPGRKGAGQVRFQDSRRWLEFDSSLGDC